MFMSRVIMVILCIIMGEAYNGSMIRTQEHGMELMMIVDILGYMMIREMCSIQQLGMFHTIGISMELTHW